MIKSWGDFFFGILLLANAGIAFLDRTGTHGLLFHKYAWLMWLIGAVAFFYRSLKTPPARAKAREPWEVVPPGKRYAASVLLWVCVFLAVPLWLEFSEPGQPFWNIFLAVFLLAMVIGSFAGVRYLQKNRVEVGEARFVSSDGDGR